MSQLARPRPAAAAPGPGTRRGLRRLDLWDLVTLAGFAGLAILVLWPLGQLFRASFFAEFTGEFGLANYAAFFGSRFFRTALWNSLTVSSLSALGAVAIGVPLAVILARRRIPGAGWVRILIVLSLMSPPFIGAYAWIILLGRGGVLTRAAQSVGIDLPTIYGPGGIVLVSVLQLYPLVFLLAYGALQRIDASLEEAAASLGRRPLNAFLTVSFPLMRPAVLTGALLVFLAVLSDFGAPILLGENYNVLATLAFRLYLSEIGGEPAMAATTSVILVAIAGVTILLQRVLLAGRRFAGDSTAAMPERRPLAGRAERLGLPAFVWAVVLVANLPLAVIVYTSFLETRGPVFGEAFSLASYRTVFATGARAVTNSLGFSALALAAIAVAGAFLGYLLARRDTAATRALDALLMIPYVIPGTVLGIGFITAFNAPPLHLTGTVAIIVLAYFIRRLPYMVRAVSAIVYQVDRSVEEASVNLGAPPMRTFRRIMLPLMAPGLLAGATLAFVEVINELSATIVLYSGHTVTMPIATYSQVIGGAYGTAAAMASLLVLVTAGALALFNLLGGREDRMSL
jgi:iron(III) transport system permease protein